MQRTKDYNREVHPKVEYPEYFRVCKGKHWYPNYFGECDSTEDLFKRINSFHIDYEMLYAQFSKYIHWYLYTNILQL